VEKLDRKDWVLAILSYFSDSSFSPVQIQKLFFLLDYNLDKIDKDFTRYFDFQPYDYGPFDRAVYDGLDELKEDECIHIDGNSWNSRRSYAITVKGFELGHKLHDSISEELQDYIVKLGEWVLKVSFIELISTIYRQYPDMKVNSVFNRN